MEKLILFSSDSHDLYIEDIFRAVCLPEGYVIHFRYEPGNIGERVLSNLRRFQDYPDCNGLVVFAVGNDSKLPEAERKILPIPVRNVRVLKIMKTPETGLIHFYLMLKDFSNLELVVEGQGKCIPPYNYVSLMNVNVRDKGETLWMNVVDDVRRSFKNQNFVSVKILSSTGDEIEPKYDSKTHESFYDLKSETSYLLDVAYYQCEPGRDVMAVKVGGPPLSIDSSDSERMGNVRDNRRFGLNIGEIGAKEITTFVKITPTLSKEIVVADSFEISLKLKLTRSYWKSLRFGLLSSILLAIPAMKVIKDDSLLGKFDWYVWPICGVLFVSTSLVIGELHRLFNKK